MAVEFTPDELDLIGQQSLPEVERPTYYSSVTQNFKPISSDFEGYLILQPQNQKQRALTWIKDAADIEVDNGEQSELLINYLVIRQEDAAQRVNELDEAPIVSVPL